MGKLISNCLLIAGGCVAAVQIGVAFLSMTFAICVIALLLPNRKATFLRFSFGLYLAACLPALLPAWQQIQSDDPLMVHAWNYTAGSVAILISLCFTYRFNPFKFFKEIAIKSKWLDIFLRR